MSNTTGLRFRLTTFGESHGTAIGGVVDGCPSGIVFDYDLVQTEMQRRHEGQHATPRRERDEVEFLSGIYEGRTLGTPIAFVIRNEEMRSDDYAELADCYRPGHADYTYEMRYGRRDPRGGGRASGRETASRVVGGAIAKMVLANEGITVEASLASSPTPSENDSSGGVIACRITGLKAGYGNPVFDKLNARLAAAEMSIPSAIGFEMGVGFAAATMSGSEFRDEWVQGPVDRVEKTKCMAAPYEEVNGGNLHTSHITHHTSFTTKSNHCGGIQGGISNGMPIEFRVAFHAPVTVGLPTECIDKDGRLKTLVPQGRHDRCHLPRTAVVVEAMAALTVADFII